MVTSITDMPKEAGQQDYFGIEKYERGLVKFIQGSATPLTIALQGEWGSGKTSLMNTLREELCSKGETVVDGKFYGVWVNAWEYAMMSTPEYTVLKIMERLIDSLAHEDEKPKGVFGSFLKKAGNFFWRGGRETLKTIPAVGGAIAVALEALNVTNQPFDENEKEANIGLGELRCAIEEAVDKIKQKNKKGVMVFVDDLDRINPKMAVELLELLKNVFQIKGCLFVLAIDYNVVVKGLSEKFGDKGKENEREFRSFFDKIIQVPFAMPINRYDGNKFITTKLHELGFFEEGVLKRYLDVISSVCENTVGKNPRSIIRLLNTLSLINCVNSCDTVKEETKERESLKKIITFCMIAMQVEYPKIYAMIEYKPNFKEWGEEIKDKYCPDAEKSNGYEEIIDSVCDEDDYLSRRVVNIKAVFGKVYDVIKRANADMDIMKEVMAQTSVTSVWNANEGVSANSIIYSIYDNIKSFVEERGGKLRKNTGKGGVNCNGCEFVFAINMSSSEIVLSMQTTAKESPNDVSELRESFVRVMEEMVESNPAVYKLYKHNENVSGMPVMCFDTIYSNAVSFCEKTQIENMKRVMGAWFELAKGM